MKIYTKKGDDGFTFLCNGEKRKKNDLRVVAYGNIDELNAFIGDVRANIDDNKMADFIKNIQSDLFNIAGILALVDQKICALNKGPVHDLENMIDQISGNLEELKSFIYPGETKLGAKCAIARTVCRRAERSIIELYESYKNEINDTEKNILQYINRLSDFIFTLERSFNGRDEKWQRQ